MWLHKTQAPQQRSSLTDSSEKGGMISEVRCRVASATRSKNRCNVTILTTHCYFVGSGRVTFNNHKSFMKAVQAAFIEIRTPKFTKKVKSLIFLAFLRLRNDRL